MKKSIVHLVNVLKEKLFEFPKIVNKLENKDLDFIPVFNQWLQKSEEILATYNISTISEISGIRSKIIAVRYAETKNASNKKLQLKVAADSLFDAQHILLNILIPYETKVEDSKELIRQLLQIVSQAKIIKFNKKESLQYLIDEIWQFIISNDQLRPGAVKLKSTLPIEDIHILIAEEINLEDF